MGGGGGGEGVKPSDGQGSLNPIRLKDKIMVLHMMVQGGNIMQICALLFFTSIRCLFWFCVCVLYCSFFVVVLFTFFVSF